MHCTGSWTLGGSSSATTRSGSYAGADAVLQDWSAAAKSTHRPPLTGVYPQHTKQSGATT